jgi:cell division protein FtsX
MGTLLGLAGGIAVILIIIAGYRLMASQGNPEAVQAAREQIISAIVGLVFVIFSLVILQVIGVDILKIPGFGR